MSSKLKRVPVTFDWPNKQNRSRAYYCESCGRDKLKKLLPQEAQIIKKEAP